MSAVERIAHLVYCTRCKGLGVLPARISLGGGSFTPGGVCGKCNGSGVVVVGGCECCEVDEEDAPD